MRRPALDELICARKQNRARDATMFVALCSLLLAACLPAHAQPAKAFKVGWLESSNIDRASKFGQMFFHRLAELGLAEGKNIAFEFRSAENQLDRLPALADELVRVPVDVLLTTATPALIAARNATKTMPIVFMQLAVDPVAAGFVDSLARPGGNTTGLTILGAELAGKRLEILKETVPKPSRVAILWEPKNAGSAQAWKESQAAGKALGLALHSMEVNTADNFESAFKDAVRARSAAVAVTPMVLANANRQKLVDLAVKSRLPAIYYRDLFIDSGGLMSYGPDLGDHYKRAAEYVEKVLRGTKPADLPVEQPKKFEFVVNLKAAKQIGLTVPPNVLARADKVIR